MPAAEEKAADEARPLLKKHVSSAFETAKYHDERTWSGFSSDSLSFPEGEAEMIRYPRAYNYFVRFLIFAHFVTGVLYIMWIGQDVFDGFGFIIGPTFLAAEFLSFITRIVCFSQYITKQHKAICPLKDLSPKFPESQWPIVQFCVTHYKEPVAETYPTLNNLIELDYPMDKLEINILDDGYFNCKEGVYTPSKIGEEMTAMIRALVTRKSRGHGAEHMETEYEVESSRRPEAAPTGSRVIEFKHEAMPTVRQICRKRAKESHFKGGNLNNAVFNVLNEEKYQYYAFLDCDMAPTKDFLQLSMPAFFKCVDGRWVHNWEVAMTQAPQCFHNLNETNGDDDPLFQQTDVYWRRTMQHLDHWGLVHYYGTNVVMFKPALEDVVGWQYGVLSEDTPTGANLTSLGWQAKYVDQEIAAGLVKDTVVDTLSQRKRWAEGNVMWGLLKNRSFLKCLLTSKFYDPPFFDAFLNREAAAIDGELMPVPNTSLVPVDPEQAGMASESPLGHDCGYDERKRRASSFWYRSMWAWSYWHVTWSNPVNAFWFVAYVMCAVYMLFQFGTRSDTVSLNVLYPALHFGITTTLLFVIGPQSTMWRGCQDRFAFAWVRLVAIYDSCEKAMKTVANAPWNSSAYGQLMAPPMAIFIAILGMWSYSMVNCGMDYETCFEDFSSESLTSADIPTQIVGLFLGLVILVSMWPLFRSACSNIAGYKMYKFRCLPGGALVPYALATAPVIIFATMFIFLGTETTSTDTTSMSTQVCVQSKGAERLSPSVFILGCSHCATTSFYQDVSVHFPQFDSGAHLLTGDSQVVAKDKHFFDDQDTYDLGWDWYLGHYSNCSTESASDYVGLDATETYLESDQYTARKIYNDYKEFPAVNGFEALEKLKFIMMFRDPIDRLYSYYNTAKADNTLDMTGVNADDDCITDVASCTTLTFDEWAYDQIERASDCEKSDPDADLWPNCGSTGLFGGLYSQQLTQYLTYFNATQVAIVPMNAYTDDAPQLLTNLAGWLDMDYVRNGMTEAAKLSETEYADGQMASSTRSMLASFYDPYTSDLYDLIANTELTFLNIVELKDLFRR